MAIRSDRDWLTEWLNGQPTNISITIAARAALRAAPALRVVVEGPKSVAEQEAAAIVLPLLRGMASAWSAGNWPTHASASSAVRAASGAARASSAAFASARSSKADFNTAQLSSAAARAAFAAARSAAGAAISAASDAAVAVARASEAFSTTGAVRAFDAALAFDVAELRAMRSVAQQPLWPDVAPSPNQFDWISLKGLLLRLNQDWSVWVSWYQDRLDGLISNPALEVDRSLIADEIWFGGPRAVNTEIGRLIGLHQTRTDLTVPFVPPGRPAAIEPIVVGGQITLPNTEANARLASSDLSGAIVALRSNLISLADDLAGETNIDRSVEPHLRRIAENLPDSAPTQFQVFDLGHQEDVLKFFTPTVTREWPPFLGARYHAALLNFDRTMRLFPAWLEFKRNAEQDGLTVKQVAAAAEITRTAAGYFRLGEAGRFISHLIPDALIALATSVNGPEGIEAGNELLASDLVESLNNSLKMIADVALTGVSRLGAAAKLAGKVAQRAVVDVGSKAGQALVKWAAQFFAKAGERAIDVWLGSFIATYPKQLEWLHEVIAFFARHGGS